MVRSQKEQNRIEFPALMRNAKKTESLFCVPNTELFRNTKEIQDMIDAGISIHIIVGAQRRFYPTFKSELLKLEEIGPFTIIELIESVRCQIQDSCYGRQFKKYDGFNEKKATKVYMAYKDKRENSINVKASRAT